MYSIYRTCCVMRVFSCLLISSLFVLLSACGGGSQSDSSSSANSSTSIINSSQSSIIDNSSIPLNSSSISSIDSSAVTSLVVSSSLSSVVSSVTSSINTSEAPPLFKVDASGNVLKNGEIFPVRCGSWFGLEGQHEPPDADRNASGAPMELYMGNMWWVNSGSGSGRTVEQTMQEIKAQGINVIRLPIAPQTLDRSDPQGIGFVWQNGSINANGKLKNHPDAYQQNNARHGMENFIRLADRWDLEVIVDIHSCSNYIGWRAGRLNATPPWVDADRENYDYPREDFSCGAVSTPGVTVHPYDERKWLDNIRDIAGLSEQLGVDNIMAIDIFNEPWDYTWAEWKGLAERAYQVISETNSDMLIMVEGISAGTSTNIDVPHGRQDSNPNWGENFYPARDEPLNIPKDRIILSPHTYGPSVFVQPQFIDHSNPDCIGLEGDEAGDQDCQIVIDPARLEAGWEEHFGFLRDQGYAMVIGEFGGHFGWPEGGPVRDQDRWSHISENVDEHWQRAFVDYMKRHDIQACYWSINPESADTGGLYNHLYDPTTRQGWGEWDGFDIPKWNLLGELWNN